MRRRLTENFWSNPAHVWLQPNLTITNLPLIHPSSPAYRGLSLVSKETDGRPGTAVAVGITACVVLLNISLLGSKRAHACCVLSHTSAGAASMLTIREVARWRPKSVTRSNHSPNRSHARHPFPQGPYQQNTRPLSPATVRSGGPHRSTKPSASSGVSQR